MSLIDRLLGRPSPAALPTILGAALELVDAEPAEARDILRSLGDKPWDPPAPAKHHLHEGFAVRAYASWRLGDAAAAAADVALVAGRLTVPNVALPLMPLLVVESSDMGEVAAGLAATFGGCGEVGCDHHSALEACLAIVRSATYGPDISRWTSAAPATPAGVSLRLAAYRRLTSLGEPSAWSVLNGDDARLRTARARVLYDRGEYVDAIEEGARDAAIVQRAALGAIVEGRDVTSEARELAVELADADGVAAALLAESEGRWPDAVSAWTLAGRAAEAHQARVVAEHAVPADNSPARLYWFRYALGHGGRPESAPDDSSAAWNGLVGDTRAALAKPKQDLRANFDTEAHPALPALASVLGALAAKPASAPRLLSAARPDDEPLVQLLAMADSLGDGGPELRVLDWRKWNEQNATVEPLEPFEAPLAWVARGARGRRALWDSMLPPEQGLPLLAALLQADDEGARSVAASLLRSGEAAALATKALPELTQVGAALAGAEQAAPDDRRLGLTIASSALAHRVARGTLDVSVARAAVDLTATAASTIPPDPMHLGPLEAFDVELEALRAYSERSVSRALGPVLCFYTTAEPTATPPQAIASLYGDAAHASLLMKVGNVDEARLVLAGLATSDPELDAVIASAFAERHLAGNRPYDALHELACLEDPGALVGVEGHESLLTRLATAAVRTTYQLEDAQQALDDVEALLEHFDYVPEIEALAVELLVKRATDCPSLVDGLPYLEEAVEIDDSHPIAVKLLAQGLVLRGMNRFELDPAGAVGDVDRATDLYMGDAELVRVASEVAYAAAATLAKHGRRGDAVSALRVSLAIDPDFEPALQALYTLRGY